MKQVLADKCALVTGASRGLGFAIARHYLASGASVVICARGSDELERARQELAAIVTPGRKLAAFVCDIADVQQVDSLVATTVGTLGRLDILVNNAGVAGAAGTVDRTDWNAWMRTLQINLLGPIATVRAVLPHMRRAGRGKIVQISGGGATQPLPGLSAYAVSKAGIVRFVETLAEEVRDVGIEINAIAPGLLKTRLLDEMLAAGARVNVDKAVSPERGAELAVFLGSDASDGITGKILSAIWDPWATLPQHVRQLASSDIYTLRRIVPRDRGFNWGDER